MTDRHVDVAVIGAGTAGLVALRNVSAVTKNVVLIQDGPLGTTCARVGCMPSKALIQTAHAYHQRLHFDRQGLRGADGVHPDLPAVLRHVRALRDRFTGGMVARTERFGDRLIRGRARFLEPTVLDAGGTVIRADRVIVATGSRPIVPAAWHRFGDRIWTSDTFFELDTLPATVAVIGLGVVGLELGQAMARLGIDVLGVARSQHLGGMDDPDVLESAAALFGAEMTLWRGQPVQLSDAGGSLRVTAGEQTRSVDGVLAAVGRRPNVDGMGFEDLGTPLRPDGVPVFDPDTLQVGSLPIYLAGDANAMRPILHEAWDDGRIAGYNAVHAEAGVFPRRTPLHVVFTDPTIAFAGSSFRDLADTPAVIGSVRFDDQPRALIMNENRGILRLYAHAASGQLLGAQMCAPAGEHLGHLLAWAIQQRLTVRDLLRMPFYHPVIEEGLRDALESMID